jgi:hypothetical protein
MVDLYLGRSSTTLSRHRSVDFISLFALLHDCRLVIVRHSLMKVGRRWVIDRGDRPGLLEEVVSHQHGVIDPLLDPIMDRLVDDQTCAFLVGTATRLMLFSIAFVDNSDRQ